MKLLEKLNGLIVDSELKQVEKNIIKGFINRAEDVFNKKTDDNSIIEKFCKKSFEVVLSTDEVKIYKVVNSKDDWDIKYPYRSVWLNEKGDWVNVNHVSPTVDIAYLNYVQNKHLGANSQFTDFAIKMLDINMKDYE